MLGGFGSIPGALVGGIIIGLIELFAGAYLPDGFKDVARLHRAAADAGRPAAGPVRHRRPQEGLSAAMRFPSRPPTTRTSACSATAVAALLVRPARRACSLLPLAAADDYLSATSACVFIYGICGVSLMVLAGYTGLVSLGHAAFLGIGAYAHAYFIQHLACRGSWRWSLAVLITAAVRRWSSACRRCA